MLVVFGAAPVATPAEAGCGEEAMAEVASLDLVGEGARTVHIGCTGGGLGDFRAAAQALMAGVVEGVDVDSHAESVLGDEACVGYEAEVEGGGVVGAHGTLVVGIPMVDKEHALYGVTGTVELPEDVEHDVGNLLVDDHLADEGAAVDVGMQAAQIAQGGAWRGALRAVGLAVHDAEDGVGEHAGAEERLPAAPLDDAVGHHVARHVGALCLHAAMEQQWAKQEQQGEYGLVHGARG